jgi:CcmD family protein
MSPLAYVGVAYASIWILLLVYAWRLTRTARDLDDRLDAIERKTTAANKR